jgi:uncharacterized protein with HEPN domain
MTEDRLADFLHHIRVAAVDAQAFVEGLTKEEFLADKRTQQAVIMSLLIVGEAATKTMTQFPQFVAVNSHVPWQSMRGMRNRLAHGYFEINLEVVWETVQSALPDLLAKLDQTSKPQ